MQVDFHGYHPRDVFGNGKFEQLVQQAWEMGETELRLIHGHGRRG